MCIVFLGSAPGYTAIIAANRDEFLARGTTPARWHSFQLPSLASHADPTSATPTSSAYSLVPTTEYRVLSGLDTTAGGTQMGISLPPSDSAAEGGGGQRKRMRFTALTNYTEVISGAGRPSRGKLTKDWLEGWGKGSLKAYLEQLESTKAEYAGFNLLVAELSDDAGFTVGYTTNRDELGGRVLPKDAVLGVSNDTLVREEEELLSERKRWPKVVSGGEAFKKVLEDTRGEEDIVEGLLDVLSTSVAAPITERIHLRYTVLVKPIALNPKALLPPTVPSLDGVTSSPTPTPSQAPPPAPPSSASTPAPLEKEGTEGRHWYSTRKQTIIFISEPKDDGTINVVLVERDAYGLNEGGVPEWSGQTRRFEFENIHPEITTEEICNTTRGGILQQICYIPDKHICFVTFIDGQCALAFYQTATHRGLSLQNRRFKIGREKSSGPTPPGIAMAGNIEDLVDFGEERLKKDFGEHRDVELVNNASFVNFTNIADAIKAI
ncbi:hypothetical protein MNV49_000082 [Pseudohyphozyma bogoriensis]|nr:hypothetical protein MNV49_000082 [Pseudohyphozyma bogoriensis]